MAKKLIRYLLEGDGTVPAFVEDGGYFPVGEELVGKSVDEDSRHIPVSVARMTRAELLARIESMNILDLNGDPVVAEDVANAFLERIGLADLQ